MKSRDCRRYEESIALSAVESLAPEEQPEIESHLSHCPECQRFRQELGELHRALLALEEGTARAEPAVLARRQWHDAIRRSQFQSPRANLASPSLGPGRANQWSGLKAVFAFICQKPGFACLALVWVLIFYFNVSHRGLPVSDEPVYTANARQLFLVLRAAPLEMTGLIDLFEPGRARPEPSLKSRSGRRGQGWFATV